MMQNLPLFPDDDPFDFSDDDLGELEVDSQGTFTVGALTNYIRRKFETDRTLQDVWVEGEISNLTRASSGHVYFTLKDADAQLKAVMWKSSAVRLRFDPQHGDQVLAHGNISVYEPRGEYQLYATTLQPTGLGDLNQQFELLKEKLAAEGLFDPERKQSLPFFPRRIGVVTSPTTAAFQDVLNVLRRRFPVAQVILSPAQVQGKDAPPQIIAALERLYQQDDIDVILLVRGGGSLEDLWCFNDENVVRKVVSSPIPLVAGVGHEIDFTLVDFAADQRAPTPSAAAELVTPEADALSYSVQILQQQAYNAMQDVLDIQRQSLRQQRRTLQHLSPQHDIQNFKQRIDTLSMRLERGVQTWFDRKQHQFQQQAAALQSASPTAILSRGYAIVSRAGDGKRLTDAIDAAEGVTLDIQLHIGTLKASVKSRDLETD
jgi:exodeoxyribonuclease VII large subunit